jgi:hypothetical protein
MNIYLSAIGFASLALIAMFTASSLGAQERNLGPSMGPGTLFGSGHPGTPHSSGGSVLDGTTSGSSDMSAGRPDFSPPPPVTFSGQTPSPDRMPGSSGGIGSAGVRPDFGSTQPGSTGAGR